MFSLEDPGNPEAAKNVDFNAPEGVFGNPNALTRCTAADFALMECPVNSQAGVITLNANYEGDPKNSSSAPLPSTTWRRRAIETARLAFFVPTVEHPDRDPDLRAHRETTTACVSRLPKSPSRFRFSREIHGLGAARGSTPITSQRFAKGSPGEPAGLPGPRRHELRLDRHRT